MLFRGAINDELGAWEGGEYYISEHCNVFQKPSFLEKCKKIEALWCDGDGPAWTYKTNIPHETFNIYEEDELFCIGIVFSMKEAFGAEIRAEPQTTVIQNGDNNVQIENCGTLNL